MRGLKSKVCIRLRACALNCLLRIDKRMIEEAKLEFRMQNSGDGFIDQRLRNLMAVNQRGQGSITFGKRKLDIDSRRDGHFCGFVAISGDMMNVDELIDGEVVGNCEVFVAP